MYEFGKELLKVAKEGKYEYEFTTDEVEQIAGEKPVKECFMNCIRRNADIECDAFVKLSQLARIQNVELERISVRKKGCKEIQDDKLIMKVNAELKAENMKLKEQCDRLANVLVSLKYQLLQQAYESGKLEATALDNEFEIVSLLTMWGALATENSQLGIAGRKIVEVAQSNTDDLFGFLELLQQGEEALGHHKFYSNIDVSE